MGNIVCHCKEPVQEPKNEIDGRTEERKDIIKEQAVTFLK